MNKKRLLMLADYLEGIGAFEGRGIPKSKFNIENWMHADKFVKVGTDENGSVIVKPASQNASGCAIGWAATMPEFQEQGLALIASPGSDQAVIKYDSYYGFLAVAKFFDITDLQAIRLFSIDNYKKEKRKDPRVLVKKIREFVKKG